MVKKRNKNNAKSVINQGESGCTAKASKIGVSTPYEYCSELPDLSFRREDR